MLAIELQELLTLDLDFDITITGFEIPEIDLLLSPGDDTPDADEFFEIEGSSEPRNPTRRYVESR